MAKNPSRIRRVRGWKPGFAGVAHDCIFCLPSMPGHSYTRGDGLGVASGAGEKRGDQWLLLAIGAVGIKSFNSSSQPGGGGAGAPGERCQIAA